MENKLIELQDKIYKYHNSEEYGYHLEYSPRISFSRIGDLFEIIFYGDGFDDDCNVHSSEFEPNELNFGFCALQDFLIENPNKIISLVFNGADTGANGTKSWNFNRIVNSNIYFENLKIFKVQLTDVGDHNQSVIGEFDEEDGMIAKLISKMPNLEKLELPSAPNQDFFNIPNLNISSLTIQAGYSHQNFIENLSQSNNFKNLKMLDYTEPYDHFEDLEENDFTSFENFKELFKSNTSCALKIF